MRYRTQDAEPAQPDKCIPHFFLIRLPNGPRAARALCPAACPAAPRATYGARWAAVCGPARSHLRTGRLHEACRCRTWERWICTEPVFRPPCWIWWPPVPARRRGPQWWTSVHRPALNAPLLRACSAGPVLRCCLALSAPHHLAAAYIPTGCGPRTQNGPVGHSSLAGSGFTHGDASTGPPPLRSSGGPHSSQPAFRWSGVSRAGPAGTHAKCGRCGSPATARPPTSHGLSPRVVRPGLVLSHLQRVGYCAVHRAHSPDPPDPLGFHCTSEKSLPAATKPVPPRSRCPALASRSGATVSWLLSARNGCYG